MLGKIYKIVNDLNDKVYVGQTIRSLAERFQKHCNLADDIRRTMAIKKAILKYGKEHFRIELIEECDVSELNEREQYWIEFYDAYTKGYNCTKGGQGCGHSQKLTQDEEEELTILYKMGVSSLVLASLFKVDKTTVLNYVKKHGLKIHHILENIVDVEKPKTYIRENEPSVSEVAEKFHISKCSVYNILKQANDETLVIRKRIPKTSNAVIHAKDICEKYNEGYNIQDLIKMFHSPKRYISKVLKENGIEIQRGRKARL